MPKGKIKKADHLWQRQCRNKIGFDTEDEARVYAEFTYSGTVKPYKCSVCKYWHVGHTKRNRKREHELKKYKNARRQNAKALHSQNYKKRSNQRESYGS